VKKRLLIALVLVLPLFGLLFLQKCKPYKAKSIVKISQLSLQKEAVSSLYLTELLGLCVDKPVTCEEFDLQSAKAKLLASPLIDDAEVSFIADDHIQVRYFHVTAVAVLSDFKNVGIDKQGKLFPVRPFLSPRGLVQVFLGIEEVLEGRNISVYKEYQRWLFAKKVLDELQALSLEGVISAIDVSHIEERSLGKNELIVSINNLQRKDILRLSRRNYLNEVSNYIILCNNLKNERGTLMIDFRLDDAALIEKFD
jgi:hypothetical protein